MLLKPGKKKQIKIKSNKSSWSCCLLVIVLVAALLASGVSFKGEQPISFLKGAKGKINLKVNYNEGPNQADFFTSSDLNSYVTIEPHRDLNGLYLGFYDLKKESIFWINPNLDRSKIYRLISFGPYNIYFNFKLAKGGKHLNLEISQGDIRYGSVEVDVNSRKQTNYWTKAHTKNWLEVIRGKIFKASEKDLFTLFQTTVYEDRIPIYAFRGSTVLRKSSK